MQYEVSKISEFATSLSFVSTKIQTLSGKVWGKLMKYLYVLFSFSSKKKTRHFPVQKEKNKTVDSKLQIIQTSWPLKCQTSHMVKPQTDSKLSLGKK